MNLSINQFWNEETPAPPQGQTIQNYFIESQIRSPTNSSYVFLGTKIGDDQKKAIKFVKCKENRIDRIINEIDTMSEAHHSNILEIEDYFQYKEYICIVTPYMPLGSLHQLVQSKYKRGMPEHMAKVILKQMLDAIIYLHGINIWHRDIKPDNFLVLDDDQNHPCVVLADFGFAKRFEKESFCSEFLCTPEFCPPEIMNSIPYTNKVDVYSLGITLFVMLTGNYPVCSYASNPSRCRDLIRRGMLNYGLLKQRDISQNAIDLIKAMCYFDPGSRISAAEAIEYQWIISEDRKNIPKKVIHDDFSVIPDNKLEKILQLRNCRY